MDLAIRLSGKKGRLSPNFLRTYYVVGRYHELPQDTEVPWHALQYLRCRQNTGSTSILPQAARPLLLRVTAVYPSRALNLDRAYKQFIDPTLYKAEIWLRHEGVETPIPLTCHRHTRASGVCGRVEVVQLHLLM